MKKFKCKEWLRAMGVRSLKTVAQTAVAMIGTAAVLTDVDWLAVGSAALLAGVLSVLTSLAGLPECADDEDEVLDEGGDLNA